MACSFPDVGIVVDPWLDARTQMARRLVLARLASWLITNWSRRDGVRLLDVGCGDLTLASMLPASIRVDGVDPSVDAVRAARATLATTGRPGAVVGSIDQLPVGMYDGAVLSSVVQYLPDGRDLESLLSQVAGRLDPDGVGMVITDVPDERRMRALLGDGWDLLRFLRTELGAPTAVYLTASSARRRGGTASAVSGSDLAAVATRLGFDARRLPENLSPFRRRGSWHLVRDSTA